MPAESVRTLKTTRPEDDSFKIKWKILALANALIAVAALTTIVILTATTDGDALSSVALILAVLAFVIQIIVFIADFVISSRRDQEARELHTATSNLLVKIEEKSDATSSAVAGEMAKMIDNLIVQSMKHPVEGDVAEKSGDDVRRETLREVRDNILLSQVETPSFREPIRQPPSRGRFEALSQWPSRRTVDHSASRMQKLKDPAWKTLGDLAGDVIESYENGVAEGLTFLTSERPALAELQRGGFVRVNEFDVATLDYRGMAAARLLTADGPVPEYVTACIPSIAELRQKYGPGPRPGPDADADADAAVLVED
jgi:hypothetical protein